MRISESTYLYYENGKHFVVNIVNGTMDEVELPLYQLLADLKREKKIFLNGKEAGLDEELADYLLDRKYITVYANKEENRETEAILDRKYSDLRQRPKDVFIVLGNAGFLKAQNNSNNSNTAEKRIKDLLNKIQAEEDIGELNFWIDKEEVGRIEKLVLGRKKYFNPAALWVSIDRGDEFVKKVEKIKNFKEVRLILRSSNLDNAGDYKVFRNGQIIEGNFFDDTYNDIFKGTAYLPCPFAYKKIFFNVDGKKHYCIEELAKNRGIESVSRGDCKFNRCEYKECVLFKFCNISGSLIGKKKCLLRKKFVK